MGCVNKQAISSQSGSPVKISRLYDDFSLSPVYLISPSCQSATDFSSWSYVFPDRVAALFLVDLDASANM